MDGTMESLEQDTINYNKVKNLVVNKLKDEGFLSEEEAAEFCTRCQVMLYKGKWYEKWFKKGMPDGKLDGYYLHIIEMQEKHTSLDDIIRRTANER